jgi:hypothetical protein
LSSVKQEFQISIFDASAWEDGEGAYWDGHHLLGPAAEKFSKRLGKECVEPWLRGERP